MRRESLNRVTRATCDGWEYECDQRHVEIILEHLELQKARPLSTRVADDPTTEVAGDKEPLRPHAASLYRATSARASYITQDRSDVQYAVQELCHRMFAPTKET